MLLRCIASNLQCYCHLTIRHHHGQQYQHPSDEASVIAMGRLSILPESLSGIETGFVYLFVSNPKSCYTTVCWRLFSDILCHIYHWTLASLPHIRCCTISLENRDLWHTVHRRQGSWQAKAKGSESYRTTRRPYAEDERSRFEQTPKQQHQNTGLATRQAADYLRRIDGKKAKLQLCCSANTYQIERRSWMSFMALRDPQQAVSLCAAPGSCFHGMRAGCTQEATCLRRVALGCLATIGLVCLSH